MKKRILALLTLALVVGLLSLTLSGVAGADQGGIPPGAAWAEGKGLAQGSRFEFSATENFPSPDLATGYVSYKAGAGVGDPSFEGTVV
jgi:hypothetical protein